jgi:hypothetical protein
MRHHLLSCQVENVLKNRHIRPVFAKDTPAKEIAFAHGDGADARGFGSQVEAANPAEKRQSGHIRHHV